MRYILILLTVCLFLSASNIDAQIEAIRKAPVEKRFELMNAFKRQLVQMQEKERIRAIHKLKNITRSKYANRAIKEIKAHQHAIRHKAQSHNRQHLDDRTEHNIDREIESHIENQIESTVENHVEEGVENEIENQLEDEDHDD